MTPTSDIKTQTVGLDPDVRTLIDDLQAHSPGNFSTLPPSQARRAFEQMQSLMRGTQPPALVDSVRDLDVSSVGGHRVPVRVYEPATNWDGRDVVLYLHGGGWVFGDLDTADRTARAITQDLSAQVVSVGYRLAPEHPFPAAFDDCRAVLEELTRTHPTARISVVGDSAGGNLAAALALASRDESALRVDAQLLLYPAFDPHQSSRSHQQFADGFVLTRADMKDYWDKYLPTVAGRVDPRATPFGTADLRGLPPAMVVTAGFDPLRDEGQRYAERLVAASVATTYLPFPRLIHGWLDITGRVPAADQALRHVLRAFACLLATSASPSRP